MKWFLIAAVVIILIYEYVNHSTGSDATSDPVLGGAGGSY